MPEENHEIESVSRRIVKVHQISPMNPTRPVDNDMEQMKMKLMIRHR